MTLARLVRSIAVVALVAAACGGNSKRQGAGGAGGGSGAGGRGGGSGGPLTQCPPTIPTWGAACEATGYCGYAAQRCRCEGCTCGTIFACINGKFEGIEVIDSCPPGPCQDGGWGGTGWDGSASGGAGGSGSLGDAAAGGTSGSGGTAPLTSCPVQTPKPATSCTGSFTCDYDIDCRCGGCCTYTYECTNDELRSVRHTSDCMRVCDAGTD